MISSAQLIAIKAWGTRFGEDPPWLETCSREFIHIEHQCFFSSLELFSLSILDSRLSLTMPHYTFAVALSTLLAVYALRKKSLSKDGAAGAFALGMVTFSSNYWLFTVVLLVFFLSSSKLTKANEIFHFSCWFATLPIQCSYIPTLTRLKLIVKGYWKKITRSRANGQ